MFIYITVCVNVAMNLEVDKKKFSVGVMRNDMGMGWGWG
jgi:hypothetical protein